MSDLEQFVIHNAQPSSLAAKVFQSLIVQPVHASNPGGTPVLGELGTPLCPLLRRFGLQYDRWLRQSEEFDLIPIFISIIRSRQQSKCSLRRFNLWIRGSQKNPLRFIEGSQLWTKGFVHLAEQSGIELDSTALESMQRTPKHSDESSLTFHSSNQLLK